MRSFEITGEPANASVPATWSRCQWLRTTVIRRAPRRPSSSWMSRPCSSVVPVSWTSASSPSTIAYTAIPNDSAPSSTQFGFGSNR